MLNRLKSYKVLFYIVLYVIIRTIHILPDLRSYSAIRKLTVCYWTYLFYTETLFFVIFLDSGKVSEKYLFSDLLHIVSNISHNEICSASHLSDICNLNSQQLIFPINQKCKI